MPRYLVDEFAAAALNAGMLSAAQSRRPAAAKTVAVRRRPNWMRRFMCPPLVRPEPVGSRPLRSFDGESLWSGPGTSSETGTTAEVVFPQVGTFCTTNGSVTH